MPRSESEQRPLPPDFYRLWGSITATQVGGALGIGALPMIAILVLRASDLQVSLMVACAGIGSAVVALPLGTVVEFRRKRPVMIQANLCAFLALSSVPLAALAGLLTYAQLCAVLAIQTLTTIVFGAANGAYLKSLLPEPHRVLATSRIETTLWTATTVGPPLGGVLVSMIGATVTVALDAVGYLLSALGIRSITTAEAEPAPRPPDRDRRTELRGGWRYIRHEPILHRLFWNGMIFGGSILLVGPLIALLMLRELGFAPWQYGLALGVPALGGLLGSLCAPRLVARWGRRTVLLGSGTLRTCWLGLFLLAGPDTAGLVLMMVADTLLLFCAGVFNPVFVTYRMNRTADDHMARVGTAWSVGAKCVQPVFIAAGGVLAAVSSTRVAIGVAAVVLLGCSALLPWGQTREMADSR